MNRHDRLAQASQSRKEQRRVLKFQAQKAIREEQRRILAEQIQRLFPDLANCAVQFSKAIEQLGKAIRDMKIDLPDFPSAESLYDVGSTPEKRQAFRKVLDGLLQPPKFTIASPVESEQEKAWTAYAKGRRWA